jgi:hypothetical protein
MNGSLPRRWALAIAIATGLGGSFAGPTWAEELGGEQGAAALTAESPAAVLPVPALTSHQKETFEAGQEALKKSVTIKLENTPLTDALKELQKAAGCKIQLDDKSLSDAGIPLETQITVSLEDVSLRTALEQITRPHDLAWTFRAPGFVVTTSDNLRSNPEFRVVVLYPVGDLVKTPDPGEDDYDSLIDGLTTSVDPKGWIGEIKALPSANALSISQTWQIHERVEAFLAALRQVKKQQSLPPGSLMRPAGTPGGGGGF